MRKAANPCRFLCQCLIQKKLNVNEAKFWVPQWRRNPQLSELATLPLRLHWCWGLEAGSALG
jgi:hypothetical protein